MFEEYHSDNTNGDGLIEFQDNRYQSGQFFLRQLKQIQIHTELIQKMSANFSKQDQTNLLALQSVESDFEGQMNRSESTISIFSLSRDLNNYSSTYQERLKYGSEGMKCLREIKQKCSAQTFSYLSKMVGQNRKSLRRNNMHEKENNKLQNIKSENQMFQNQIKRIKRQVKELEQQIVKLRKQNAKISQKSSVILTQESKLLKREESLIYQRKICNNLQRQIHRQMSQLQQMYHDCQKMNDNSPKELRLQEQSQDCNLSSCKEQDDCNHLSKSTIESLVERPEISEIWAMLTRLETLTKINCT